MDYLRRHTAPMSERVWKVLDEAVGQAARHVLAARRVATFDGPHGWDHVAARLGTMTPCGGAPGRAVVCMPNVVLLSEIRAEFSLPWSSIEVFERGAPVLDTDAAEAAAREAALAEDRLVFYGDPVGNGLLTGKDSPHARAKDWMRPGAIVADLVGAVEMLDERGIPGPYEAVLSTARYYAYLQAVDAVHRSPVIQGAGAVFSTRGDDFVLTVGGDLAAGYRLHDREAVHLFCVETIAAQTVTAEAVCVLEA